MSTVLDQGIDKLERTLKALPDPQQAPELVLHLHGLRRVQAAAATLREAAAESPSPGPARDLQAQMLPVLPASTCPELFRGLVELAVGLAECTAASGSITMPDGLDTLLFGHTVGLLRAFVEVNPQAGMRMAALDASEVKTPLVAVAALAAYALVGNDDDAERTRCSWLSYHAVMGAVWPDSGSAARLRTLKRNEFVPPPPTAAEAAAAADSTAAPEAGSLAAALADDLASYAPGVTLRNLRDAAATNMVHMFSSRQRLTPAQMQQLLVRVYDVPSGRAAGCFQLGDLFQAAGRAGYMTHRRFELLTAYIDGAAAVMADADCTHAGFVLAEAEASICCQVLQCRGRPEMRWLTPQAAAGVEARGRAALERAAACLRRLKAWLQPHKLAREKGRLKVMEREMAAAARSAPARDARPQDLPLVAAEACSHCQRGALHLRKCAACRSVAYCSRECQVAHWKEGGHKRECKALAAQAQGGMGSGSGSAGGNSEGV